MLMVFIGTGAIKTHLSKSCWFLKEVIGEQEINMGLALAKRNGLDL